MTLRHSALTVDWSVFEWEPTLRAQTDRVNPARGPADLERLLARD